MSNAHADNKRIAKNTLILYLRMFITVGISLYTTRLVMANLGVSDYGLYSIVGGVTGMMYMITASVSTSISRFITFQLGTGDTEKLKRVFATSVIILVLFSLLVVLVAETIGLWFVNNRLNVDAGRMGAANWVYQLTIVAFILEFLSIPYSAAIVSHEHMKTFAYVTIFDCVVRLLIAIAIAYSPFDSLVYYAVLICAKQIILRIIYYTYCRRNFEECTFRLGVDRSIFKGIMSYYSWTMVPTIVCMFASTGVSIMMNMYFGTIANAAQSVSGEVNGKVNSFAGKFGMALAPQITKSYAANNIQRSLYLVYTGAKFSFLLLFFPVLVVMFETDFILKIWLKEVPPYTTLFITFILINSLVYNLLGNPSKLTGATGDIKINAIVVTSSYLIPFPLCYAMFEMGCPPYFASIATLIATLVTFYPIVIASRKYTGISFRKYTSNVLVPLAFITMLSVAVMMIPHLLMRPSWIRLIVSCVLSVTSVGAFGYYFALNEHEKRMIVGFARNRLRQYGFIRYGKR